MPEKRSSPKPPQDKRPVSGRIPCPFCTWTGSTNEHLRVHQEKYHEERLAGEGVKSLREGDDKWKRNEAWLLAHGYVKCPWWTVPCPTRVNPIMARVCKHMNACPI